MALAIKVENLSKAYQLGEIGTGTLSRDLERWFAKVRGKEDPFLTIGETNDRTSKGTSDVVWSLKDLNFEIQEGDAVGIIGRNGAGKSTLLKLLSRVTSPTKGNFKVKGRIASLLEVGTGFHPELTGRENIFLNGAILGMRKKEIKRKFDEILDFSGVERYVDTPVKRYSSGMYVRLAFAVAAYLESEILIVDEVLAVGDAEFQKKCLGKMGEVSKGEGRTILFVSHNMSAIINLCSKGLLLHQGMLSFTGTAKDVVDKYIISQPTFAGMTKYEDMILLTENQNLKILSVSLNSTNGKIAGEYSLSDEIVCNVEYQIVNKASYVVISMQLLDKYGECIMSSLNSDSANLDKDHLYGKILLPGVYLTKCHIPAHLLNDNSYLINILVSPDETFQNSTFAEHVIAFQTYDTGETSKEFTGKWIGSIRPKLKWSSKSVQKEEKFLS